MGRFLRRKRVAETPSEGVWQVPTRFNFARDVVEAYAADPLRPALTFVDRDGVIDRRTFAEIAADANRWAGLLRARGLAPGDRLLVLVGKTPSWHGVLLGALKAGLVTVPCSEQLRSRDLDFRAEHSGAKLVVADSARAAELARMEVPLDIVIVEEVKAELRELSALQPTWDTGPDDIAFILYTSGTTKDPKGATHTHGYTWAKRLQAEHWLDARPGDLVWCTAGTGWAKSIWNVLLGPWSRGAELVVHDGGFDAEQRFDLLQRLGVTVLCQAPTEYRLMAKVPALERFDLSRLRHAVSAGEPLNPEVIKLFRDAFGVTVLDGYGQTENTLLVANARGAELKPGSMGLPTPGHDVAVIDEDGREQPVGVEGDIALRGRPPSLFLGYWNAPEETSAVFRGQWYLTGDRATRDADGYLWFTGRADDVILSAAYRIGPFEVESALLEHPAVAESAVIGKPDADRGEIVKAFVVLRPEIEPSAELVVELQDHVKAVTAPYKYPREIAFVDELPKTASGKIRRVELRRGEQALTRTARPSVLAASTVTAEPESGVETAVEADIAVEVDAMPAVDAMPPVDPMPAVAAVPPVDLMPAVDAVPAVEAEAESWEAADEAARRAAAELAVLEEARRLKEARAAEAAERAAAEAALRAERRADLERRTAEAAAAAAAAAEQARREEEQREAERAARAAREAEARLAAEAATEAEVAAQARRDEEREAARAAREAERAAREEQARLASEATAAAAAAEQLRRSEQESREATAAAQPAQAAELTDRQRKAAEKQRREEEKAAAEQAKRDEAEAKRAAEAKARDDERQRKEDEKRRREEEKAAAEQAKRDEAEAKRAAEAKARDDERQRKEDEKRRREEEKAAAEQAKRDEEARVRAERKAEDDRRAAEAEQREVEERLRKEAERQRKDEERRRRDATRKPTLPDPPEEDEFEDDEQRLNPALISRLRAYGRREDEDPGEDARDADPPAA